MFLMQVVLAVFAVFCLYHVECAVLPENELYQLDIVHYNDFHARFEETSIKHSVCLTDDNSCLGGFARLYQEIDTLLKEKPHALVLNAGDTFQNTYWYTFLKWDVTQKFINLLPNDAHALGNHEFDDGIEGLAPYLAALRAPVVVANMNTSSTPELQDLYKPHIILERKGRKIGIFGLITPDTKQSSNVGNVTFLDPIVIAQKEAKLLTKKGADIIILLSHCGLDVDKTIAENVGENIDVIVGGHSHSLLWKTGNEQPPSGELVSGPYPVLVQAKARPEHKVLIVTASAFTKYLGNLTLYFNRNGELQDYSGEPIFLNRSIPENPEIKAMLEPYKIYLQKMVKEVVGEATDELLDKSCNGHECALGDLVADSFLDAALSTIVPDLPHVVLINRNMLRGSIGKGDITRGNVINVLPFGNTVVAVTLSGEHILQALENCLSKNWSEHPFTGPYIPQVSGMKVTLNTTSLKLVSALIKQDGEYVDIDPKKDFRLVTVSFLTEGGNGFTMLENGYDVKIIGSDFDILERFIRKQTPLSPNTDGRLTLVT